MSESEESAIDEAAPLSADSRRGYAGLGPLTLGMAMSDVKAAAQVALLSNGGCFAYVSPPAGSGLAAKAASILGTVSVDVIWVHSPVIKTISGVGVGNTLEDVMRTYPNAVREQLASIGSIEALTISNPERRQLGFSLVDGDRVGAMWAALNAEIFEGHSRC